MTYKDQIEAAKKKGTGVSLVTQIIQWKSEGDTLIGVLKEQKVFDKGDFDGDCQQYFFETDEGIVSAVLGQIADTVFSMDSKIGHLIEIVYHGKKATKKGNQVNDFEITDYGKAGE